MSLINQVLRDLDRRARPSDRLPAAVRAVAAAHGRLVSPQVTVIAVAVLVALGGGAWLRFGPMAVPSSMASAASLPTPAAPPSASRDALTSPGTPLSRTTPSASVDPFDDMRVTAGLASRLKFDASGPQGDSDSRAEGTASMHVAVASLASPVSGPGRLMEVASAAIHVPAQLRLDGLARRDDAINDADGGQAPHGAVGSSTEPASLSAHLTEVASASPSTHIEKRRAVVSPAERANEAYRLGLDAQQRGDDATAATHYLAALREDPTLASARIGLAGVRMAQGRATDAEEALRAGLATNPQQVVLAMPLAKLLAARGEWTQAIDVLQAGLPGAAASNADYRACYGAVLQRAGQHHEAVEQFSAALRLDPSNGVWWMGLAISLSADSRTEAARSAYKQSLAAGGLSPELAQFVEQRLRQLM